MAAALTPNDAPALSDRQRAVASAADRDRNSLGNWVCVEPSGIAVATDGHRLAAFLPSGECGERPRCNAGTLYSTAAGKLDGRAQSDGSSWYPWRGVIPDHASAGAQSLYIDAKYLRDACDAALKCSGIGDAYVTLTFGDARTPYSHAPLRIDAKYSDGSAFLALVMPARDPAENKRKRRSKRSRK